MSGAVGPRPEAFQEAMVSASDCGRGQLGGVSLSAAM